MAEDKEAAATAAASVPKHVIGEFLWRRDRNFNATRQLLLHGSKQATALYVTLDDGAEYGLNVDEATKLEAVAAAHNLSSDKVKFYQGADEVGAVLLARLAVEVQDPHTKPHHVGPKRPTVRLVWRAPNATQLIPSYETRPIIETVGTQIEAAGGRILAKNSTESPDVLFIINNFALAPQQEASVQTSSSASEYATLMAALGRASATQVLAFADVRYANGADISFVKTLMASSEVQKRNGSFAYAGWNTDGNTLGTVAANALLLHLFAAQRVNAARFTLFRLLEDYGYQADVRSILREYLSSTMDGSLEQDLDFYERFTFKPLQKLGAELGDAFALPDEAGHLVATSFPWNRTFEIALELGAAHKSFARHAADEIVCDVVIIGGSTAALASALAATDSDPSLAVCLTEPTDWVGGQLTSSMLTAIDFGKANRDASKLPSSLVSLLRSVGWPRTNPGNCWVSTACFHVSDARKWIEAALEQRAPALRVLPLAVPIEVELRRGVDSRVHGITLVQRSPRAGVELNGFDTPYSAQVRDWYDPNPSERFDKSTMRLVPRRENFTVIDASELGDLLVLAGLRVLQGTEANEKKPLEAAADVCGQAIAFTSYLEEARAAPRDSTEVRHVSRPANYSLDNHPWSSVWSYRRVATSPWPVSLQAWGSKDGDGNDWPYSYHLLPLKMAQSRRPWDGGLNMTTLAAAEDYALGWAQWFASKKPRSVFASKPTLQLGANGSGTASGLSKVPYVRDTRRSVGVGEFVLGSGDLSQATRYADRIAIGDYLYFDVHGMQGCDPPKFEGQLRPYYIPLRALTSADATNVYVAGKTMAQTQAANAATRLHPVEWSSGVAAGVAAAHAVVRGVTSAELVHECMASTVFYCHLQRAISAMAPIEW